MTIEFVKAFAEEYIDSSYTVKDIHGSPIVINIKRDLGYTFKFTRGKSVFGVCNYGKRFIGLSKPLCEANLNQLHGKIKDTILHEIAHAICVHLYGRIDGKGHDYKWQSIAKQIGCEGKRCWSEDDFGGVKKPQSKYTLVCPTNSCDNKGEFNRRPKYGRSCARCGGKGKYNDKYKMILIQNY